MLLELKIELNSKHSIKDKREAFRAEDACAARYLGPREQECTMLHAEFNYMSTRASCLRAKTLLMGHDEVKSYCIPSPLARACDVTGMQLICVGRISPFILA